MRDFNTLRVINKGFPSLSYGFEPRYPLHHK